MMGTKHSAAEVESVVNIAGTRQKEAMKEKKNKGNSASWLHDLKDILLHKDQEPYSLHCLRW